MEWSLEMNDKYDIVFDDVGNLSISKDVNSLISRMFFDITSNYGWELSTTLGIPYINDRGTGILQSTNNTDSIANAIAGKLSEFTDIISVEEITMMKDKKRGVVIGVRVKTSDGKTTNVEVGL